MGNFYANVTLRTSSIDDVRAALEALKRRAFLAERDGATVVFDEAVDAQDLDEIQRLDRKSVV